MAPHHLSELVHRLFDDLGGGLIVLVDRLAALEVHVGVLGRTADHRVVRRQGPSLVLGHEFIVDHRPHVIIREFFNLLHLMARTEAIEEVQERDARRQRGLLRDQCEVHHFLDVARAHHREARLATGRHVRMIAKDRQCLAGQRPGRDMEDSRQQLAGDLVHVGDHQQQPLRGRESRRQGAGRQSTVHGTGRPGFGLHLGDRRDNTPDVRFGLGRLGVRHFAHR